MAFEMQKYIVGSDKLPQWLKDNVTRGRAKIKKDEDGEMTSVVIYTPSGVHEAKRGDAVVLVRSGLAVVPAKDTPKVSPNGK